MLFILYLLKIFLSLREVIYIVYNKDSQALLILKSLTKLLHLILVSHKLCLIVMLGRDLNSYELSRGGSILFVSVVTPPPLQKISEDYIRYRANHCPERIYHGRLYFRNSW